jgi:ABC-type transport system involved in multi-copper enzyme maturation permease subunit
MSLKVVTWQEASAVTLWLTAAAGLFYLDSQLPGPAKAALWAVLAVGLLIVSRRFWSWLLGPLFVYDLVRTARRNRLIPVRLLYALLMLLIISVTYSRWFGFQWNDQFFEPPMLRQDLLPSFANSFFTSFVMLLISAVFLLTPIYIATAIVEERERGNLDLLLVTPLTNREIVLGIMFSRLATLSLILATGLPILSLLPFFGGVDPNLVLSAFGTAVALMLLQGSISIYVSVRAPNSLRALMNVYLVSLFGAVFWCPCMFALLYSSFSSLFYFWEPINVLRVFPGSVISLFFVGFGILRLRRPGKEFRPHLIPPRGWESIADRPVSKEVLHLQWLAQDFYRSPITDPPMLWKDFHRRRRDNVPRLIAAVAICFYFYVCLLILATTSESSRGVRALAPWAICILMFPSAITSARMVSQEKEKRTIDSLLVTDLNTREVLDHKWWASVLSMRWVLAIQAVILGMAGLFRVLHPLAAVYLLGATIVYTCFVTCLGLFISTLCEKVLKATMISVAALLVFIFAGPLGLVSPSTNPGTPTEWWFQDVMSYAFSPIDTLRCLTFDWGEWQHGSFQAWQIVAALSAVGLVALASWGLWRLTLISFERSVKGPAPRNRGSSG